MVEFVVVSKDVKMSRGWGQRRWRRLRGGGGGGGLNPWARTGAAVARERVDISRISETAADAVRCVDRGIASVLACKAIRVADHH